MSSAILSSAKLCWAFLGYLGLSGVLRNFSGSLFFPSLFKALEGLPKTVRGAPELSGPLYRLTQSVALLQDSLGLPGLSAACLTSRALWVSPDLLHDSHGLSSCCDTLANYPGRQTLGTLTSVA
eukprot:12032928-Alexandrium_andersonii.AAC.1